MLVFDPLLNIGIRVEQISGLPSIVDLAQPELRLAGLRFNPKTSGPGRGRYVTSLKLKALPNGKEIVVTDLPAEPKMRFAEWSPDGRKVSVVNTSNAKDDHGLSLWIIDVATARSRRLERITLNGIFGRPCEWLSDSQSLICRTVLPTRGPVPVSSEVPAGPVIQENFGRITPAATYEDLLKNPEDEQIFDYYAMSQVALIRLDGTSVAIGKPGVVVNATASPDGNYVLLSERHHPYSYLLPFEMFPKRVSVVNLKNGSSKQLADKPLERSPNYYVWRSGSQPFEQVTFFPNPYGNAPLPKKQVVKYKRSDGVDLSANLYLPPGYKTQDGPLPTLSGRFVAGICRTCERDHSESVETLPPSEAMTLLDWFRQIPPAIILVMLKFQ
jgi:dipeptidyl aminopeptidase/acylaminoacyl peptidase